LAFGWLALSGEALYGHFPNRADLVDAVFARAVADAHAALDTVDATGDPREALTAGGVQLAPD
jgi:AcrR family transcriptional regulator